MNFYPLLLIFQAILALKPKIFPNTKLPLSPTYTGAAAVTNSETCTNVALEILADDGSVADAAIAALLCEGITNPQSMGIGGGFLLTIYDASRKKAEVLNAREVAPAAATEDMFSSGNDNSLYNNPGNYRIFIKSFNDFAAISIGALSSAVPGELMGYWALHKKYGRIGWYDLFRPAIELARSGAPVTKYTSRIIAKLKKEIPADSNVKDVLVNPATMDYYREGDTMRRPELADTLEAVAKLGPCALYNGSLTQSFLYDIKEHGGIISHEDLMSYRATWMDPVEHTIGAYNFHTAPKPGSGQLLMVILEVMTSKLCNLDSSFWHYFVETWKNAFGLRASMTGPKMGHASDDKVDAKVIKGIEQSIKDCIGSLDPKDYLPQGADFGAEDHGTSHICVYAPNGDAVSVTSTINLSFGALYMSESTGIIMNNQMIDFHIPHHYSFRSNGANKIAPHRYPMSSMVPTIVTKNDEVRLVIGASGGFKILTATSIVALQHLFMDTPLDEAIRAKRLHHQLKPMVVEYEEGFRDDFLQSLQHLGHSVQSLDGGSNSSCTLAMYSCVNAISVVDGNVMPVGDGRRRAFAGGY